MCSKISWSEFITTIIFLSSFYYIAAIILYYRKDILKLAANGFRFNNSNKKEIVAAAFQPEIHRPSSSSNASRPMSYNEMTVAAIEESLSEEDNKSNSKTETKFNPADVHDLVEELKTIFSTAQKKKTIKQELVLTVQNKLNEYKQLKGIEIEKNIIQHIANESNEKCAIDLSKEDLQNLWKL